MRALASLVAVVVVIAVFGGAARADQCEALDADQAAWAKKLVVVGATIAPFCESCGDAAPGAPIKVTSVNATKDHGALHMHVNGKLVDLAYTYLQTGKATWTNVALMVGCPATGVTSFYGGGAGGAPGGKGGAAPIAELGPEYGACAEYVHTMNLLSRCEKMPQAARDAMRQSLDALKQSFDQWKTLDKQSRDAMLSACKQAKDAVMQSMGAMGCSTK